jgi:hypothetical protein
MNFKKTLIATAFLAVILYGNAYSQAQTTNVRIAFNGSAAPRPFISAKTWEFLKSTG